MQLVAIKRNGGFSAACNAGARQARGEVLAMVNSDVIPAGNGWLPALIGLTGVAGSARLARSCSMMTARCSMPGSSSSATARASGSTIITSRACPAPMARPMSSGPSRASPVPASSSRARCSPS
ncbi:glycosyltransferase family 2 protein [Bosea thiooxidans]